MGLTEQRLTKQQAQAAYGPGSVAVTAGAGTGKTHMLSERYLYFLKSEHEGQPKPGFSPLQVVAVTFTEKAATELRSRIRQTIARQMADRPDLLAELEAAQISTFHALAARICREHPQKAQVPPDFAVQDQLDRPLWLAETFGDALVQLPEYLYETIPYSQMREVLSALLADPLTAEQALQRGRADWEPLAQQTQQEALNELLHNAQWLWGKGVLEAYSAPGDKLDAYRLDGWKAISSIEQGDDIASALTTLTGLKVNVGSAAKWGGKEFISEVKEAIKLLRDLAGAALKAGLVTLAPNEYDAQTEAMLPAIGEAFAWVRKFLQEAKYRQRLLDFNDLEVHALKALQHPEVQQYYAQRWQVFLIDEFQDTNPTQGELLEKLTHQATLTIVGDPKQSIYGFRRADVEVFNTWQTRIHQQPDQPVALSQSFRTHKTLMDQINQIFEPVLGELHQSLEAQRDELMDPEPALQLHTVVVAAEHQSDKSIDTTIEPCRRVEAQAIADLIQTLLSEQHQIYDKPQQTLRAIQPGDIAILARNWAPLELYGNAIAARGIPILQAGGGNLLETREAKDACAMLRFLADPTDNLALAAVLRSPFFAVSDRTLYHLAQTLPDKTRWWKHLRSGEIPALTPVAETLQELLVARRIEAPSRLLQICDRFTAYTAVIANLPGAARRLADWNGLIDLVRTLEEGSFDVLAVVRRLQRIMAGDVDVPRPALEGGNAVSLMTIHGSKGLEWPVVIVPDLTHGLNRDYSAVRFDAKLGVALKLTDDEGESQKSALYTLLEQQTWAKGREEDKRVLYVALTRARDHLILTAAGPSGNSLDLLQEGLARVVEPAPIPFDPQRARPVAPQSPELPSLPMQVMVHPAGSGFSELPVTALSDYALCPLRFKFRYVDGHPGYSSGNGSHQQAMAIGSLTHKVLELGLHDLAQLHLHAGHLSAEHIQEAFDLAQRFHQSPVYQAVRDGEILREQAVSLSVNGLTLNGVVDLVGQDFVLDFKTDSDMQPHHHQFQLWAYSRATGKSAAYLAYLRHDQLHPFDGESLTSLHDRAIMLVEKLMAGDFAPTANPTSCGLCSYGEICDSRVSASR